MLKVPSNNILELSILCMYEINVSSCVDRILILQMYSNYNNLVLQLSQVESTF